MSAKNSKIYNEWFYKAGEDYQFAKAGFEDEFYTHVCYLCQQAVEKYLKGYLIFKKEEYERTHKLVRLLLSYANHDKDFNNFREECLVLDQYYTSSRYPGGSFIHFTKKEAKESLEIAEAIMKFIQKLTPYAGSIVPQAMEPNAPPCFFALLKNFKVPRYPGATKASPNQTRNHKLRYQKKIKYMHPKQKILEFLKNKTTPGFYPGVVLLCLGQNSPRKMLSSLL